jgi:hypothetical protein
MFDTVHFENPEQVVDYVDAQLSSGFGQEWQARRSADVRGYLWWVIYPAGEDPNWTNKIALMVPTDGEVFILIHSNSTAGPWNLHHCLRNATVIPRMALESDISGCREKASLAMLIGEVLKTAKPNRDDPT